MSTIVFQSSQVTSRAGLRMLQPALLTRISMRPSWPTAVATASRMLVSLRTSRAIGTTRRPSAASSLTTGARESSVRLVIARSAPAAASARANCSPEAAAGAGDEGGFVR